MPVPTERSVARRRAGRARARPARRVARRAARIAVVVALLSAGVVAATVASAGAPRVVTRLGARRFRRLAHDGCRTARIGIGIVAARGIGPRGGVVAGRRAILRGVVSGDRRARAPFECIEVLCASDCAEGDERSRYDRYEQLRSMTHDQKAPCNPTNDGPAVTRAVAAAGGGFFFELRTKRVTLAAPEITNTARPTFAKVCSVLPAEMSLS